MTDHAETRTGRCRVCGHPIYLHHGAENDFWMHVGWETTPAPHRAEPSELDGEREAHSECRMPGCDEPSAPGYDVCSDPNCFGFEVEGVDGFISSKELCEAWGAVPTADIVCNDPNGFAREYADWDNGAFVAQVIEWARAGHTHEPVQHHNNDGGAQ